MAYNPIQWLPAFKDFDWYPGDQASCQLSINRSISDDDEFVCHAKSRGSGMPYTFEVKQEGTNAGYLSIVIPGGITGEKSGFTYQIYRNDYSVVASGTIFSRTERPSFEVV